MYRKISSVAILLAILAIIVWVVCVKLTPTKRHTPTTPPPYPTVTIDTKADAKRINPTIDTTGKWGRQLSTFVSPLHAPVE